MLLLKVMVARRRKGPVYWNQPKGDIKKSTPRALAAGVALFCVAVIGGIGYTYYTDSRSQPLPAVAAPAVVPTSQPFTKHTEPPANAAVGVAVESFSSLAKIGSDASISIGTTPGATCKIEVLYDKVPAMDPGLKPQIADDFGSVTWDWAIGPATPPGMWPVNITCSRNKHSGFVQAQLDVSR